MKKLLIIAMLFCLLDPAGACAQSYDECYPNGFEPFPNGYEPERDPEYAFSAKTESYKLHVCRRFVQVLQSHVKKNQIASVSGINSFDAPEPPIFLMPYLDLEGKEKLKY